MTLAWQSPHYGHFGLPWAATADLPVGEALDLVAGLKRFWDRDGAALRAARRKAG
jgi:hypothetical protein